MDMIIRNGLIVSHNGAKKGDIAVENGKIVAVGNVNKQLATKTEINAKGKVIIPGGIDTHTHTDDEAYYKCHERGDDFYTGSVAAACGGTTTIMDFSITPNEEMPLEFAKGMIKRALDKGIVTDFCLHCCLTEVNKRTLKDVKKVIDLGIASFKAFMFYREEGLMINDGEMMALLEEVTRYGGLVGVHAENADIAEYKTKEYLASGKRDWNVHPLCKPNIVEYEAINRASFLANELDTSMYIFHMSTKEGAEFLIKSKNEGKPIYAEVCAHYLRLTDEVYDRKDGHLYLASPPFRKIDDQKKLWEAISKRAIYTFGSDHAPYTRAQKEMNLNRDGHGKLIPDFTVVDNGLPGIELRLPTLINGVHEGHITWQDLVFVNSYAASRIFGLYPRKGEIVEGADADIVVIDTEREVDINGPESLHMHCNYTPYVGLSFKGWPEITILRGNIIARDGIFVGQRGSGKFLRTNINPEILESSNWK